MSGEGRQPATPMGGGGPVSRSNSGASTSGAGRQWGSPLRSLSTTASDAALVAQLQVLPDRLITTSRSARMTLVLMRPLRLGVRCSLRTPMYGTQKFASLSVDVGTGLIASTEQSRHRIPLQQHSHCLTVSRSIL